MQPYFLAVDIFLENELGEVLLLRRAEHKKVLGGYYNGIGGKIDTLETPYAALLREVEEEAGTRRISKVELKTILSVSDEFGYWLIFTYTGTVQKKSIKTMTIAEGELEWVRKKDIPKKKLVPDLALWWRKLFQKKMSYIHITYGKGYKLKTIKIT